MAATRTRYLSAIGVQATNWSELDALLSSPDLVLERIRVFVWSNGLIPKFRKRVWAYLLGITPPFSECVEEVLSSKTDEFTDLCEVAPLLVPEDTSYSLSDAQVRTVWRAFITHQLVHEAEEETTSEGLCQIPVASMDVFLRSLFDVFSEPVFVFFGWVSMYQTFFPHGYDQDVKYYAEEALRLVKLSYRSSFRGSASTDDQLSHSRSLWLCLVGCIESLFTQAFSEGGILRVWDILLSAQDPRIVSCVAASIILSLSSSAFDEDRFSSVSIAEVEVIHILNSARKMYRGLTNEQDAVRPFPPQFSSQQRKPG